MLVAQELPCKWRHPQAYHLNEAIRQVETEWAWIVDIDDIVMVDGLRGLGDVEADVWQMGFLRSDGELYRPPALTNDEYLAERGNPYVAGSAIRVEAFREVGGFTDIAFQDWGLWRRLALVGATFQASDRAHFHYMRHPYARSVVELTPERRAFHEAQMLADEERVDLAV